jgi:hypothetical protein
MLMALKYRNVKDAFGEAAPFIVFIIHGHTDAWQVVQKHIEKKWRFATVVTALRFGDFVWRKTPNKHHRSYGWLLNSFGRISTAAQQGGSQDPHRVSTAH